MRHPALDSKDPAEREVWRSMDSAPWDGTHVQLRLRDGSIVEDAHYACNLSGEEQPPFEGWFVPAGTGFRQIAPTIDTPDWLAWPSKAEYAPKAWRPLPL